MSEKNEFSKLVEDLDQKIKKVEKKRERVQEVIKAKAPPVVKTSLQEDKAKKKFEEQKKHAKFRVKEKLTYAAIVFAIGHCLLIPMYMKYPDLFLGMFVCASISLGFICLAVIDYT